MLVVAVAVDGAPLHVLHDQEGAAVLAAAAVEQAGDVGVAERGEDLPLELEAQQDLGRGKCRDDSGVDRPSVLQLKLKKDVEGDLMVGVPARERVSFTGSKSAAGLERVRAAIEDNWTDPVDPRLLVSRSLSRKCGRHGR